MGSDLEHDMDLLKEEVRRAAAAPDEVVEIYLGAKLNYYMRVFKIQGGGLYSGDERLAILRKYQMLPPRREDQQWLASISAKEFAVRAAYFSMRFFPDSDYEMDLYEIGKPTLSDFRGVEPLLGMLGYPHGPTQTFCIDAVVHMLKEDSEADKRILCAASRVEPRSARVVLARLIGRRRSSDLLEALLEIGRRDSNHEVVEALWTATELRVILTL